MILIKDFLDNFDKSVKHKKAEFRQIKKNKIVKQRNKDMLQLEAYLTKGIICDPQLIEEWYNNDRCLVYVSKC